MAGAMQRIRARPLVHSGTREQRSSHMVHHPIASRVVAVALMLIPAVALAGGDADAHPSKQPAACSCMEKAPHVARKVVAAPPATTPEDVQRIWSSP